MKNKYLNIKWYHHESKIDRVCGWITSFRNPTLRGRLTAQGLVWIKQQWVKSHYSNG